MLTRFLGDTPLRVAIKLLVLSFIVGVVMSAIGWRPYDIFRAIGDFVSRIWDVGFDAILNSLDYLLLGAAIVIPFFLIIRILSFRSRD